MKKILIITSIIIVVLAAVCLVLINQKSAPVPEPQVQTERVQKVTPAKIKKNVNVEETPTMRDENDMPKSDVNVPEIG